MNEEANEWIDKAEKDYFSALREYRARKHINNDSACFHAQQCIEKYLKAILVSHKDSFSKTHDLLPLLLKCTCYYPILVCWSDKVEWLTQYSVLFRYPGEDATREDARKAIGIMKEISHDLRYTLGLSSHL